MPNRHQQAEQRASVILQVRSGQITATEGARRLGLSRKTYYQWEKRGLEGLLAAVEEQAPGRPRQESPPELLALQARIAELEAQLKTARQTAQLRAVVLEMRNPPETRQKPEQRIKKKRNASPRS